MYNTVGSIMSRISPNYQWIIALATPLMREISVWAMLKACSKAGGGAVPHKLIGSLYIEAWHAVFLSIILGGIATTESTYCIIAFDFILNIYHGFIKHENRLLVLINVCHFHHLLLLLLSVAQIM